jgi:hypothetical protein
MMVAWENVSESLFNSLGIVFALGIPLLGNESGEPCAMLSDSLSFLLIISSNRYPTLGVKVAVYAIFMMTGSPVPRLNRTGDGR